MKVSKPSADNGRAPRWGSLGATAVLGCLIAGGLMFSSCTCQKDLPDPPARESRLNEKDRGWGNLKERRERPDVERRDLARELPTRRERPQAMPTRQAELDQDRVPDDFPQDVPIFKDAEVVGVQRLAAGARNVLFHTDGDIPEVFEFYRDEMNGGGWNLEQEFQQNNQSFLSFKKDGMITNMTVARNPETGKQVIAVMYYEEQPLPFDEF